MLVQNRMSRTVVTTTPSRPLSDIRTMLQKRRIRQLPVVAGSRVIGIVTDRDVRSANAKANVVADVMSRKPLVVAPTASVDEAARLLRARKINALPVVERDRVVGIITASDVLQAFVDLSGVAESSYRLTLSCTRGSAGLVAIRRIIEQQRGELKRVHVEPGTQRAIIHLRLKTRRLDDLTTALESAGFEVRAVVASQSPLARRPGRRVGAR